MKFKVGDRVKTKTPNDPDFHKMTGTVERAVSAEYPYYVNIDDFPHSCYFTEKELVKLEGEDNVT